jgi:DNA-binding PadR family transcriptional regulator
MKMAGHANLLQGTLDLLILKALSTGELHGLGVSRRIETDDGRDVRSPARLAVSRLAST